METATAATVDGAGAGTGDGARAAACDRGGPGSSQECACPVEQRALLLEHRATARAFGEVRLQRLPLGRWQLAVEVRVQRPLIHVRHAVLLRFLRHRLLPISGVPAPVSFQSRRALTLFAWQSRRTTSRRPTAAALRDRAASTARAPPAPPIAADRR